MAISIGDLNQGDLNQPTLPGIVHYGIEGKKFTAGYCEALFLLQCAWIHEDTNFSYALLYTLHCYVPSIKAAKHNHHLGVFQ